MMDAVESASARLRREIEARTAALNEEISRYPGPIARCDAQLAGLLEERARLSRLAAALDEFAAIPEPFREPA
jgi:chorismate mutase